MDQLIRFRCECGKIATARLGPTKSPKNIHPKIKKDNRIRIKGKQSQTKHHSQEIEPDHSR